MVTFSGRAFGKVRHSHSHGNPIIHPSQRLAIQRVSTPSYFASSLCLTCIQADIVKMIDSQPDLAPVIRRVRGGYLKIQGTWMPYEVRISVSYIQHRSLHIRLPSAFHDGEFATFAAMSSY